MAKEQEPKMKAPVDPSNPNYYLDKEVMRDALRKYRNEYKAAEAAGLELPRVPEYLGDCFMKISTGLGMKHNFRHYSFLNDMIMDGVLTCLKYIKSFDPDMVSARTNRLVSPLSYFTQVCFFAFLNRIKEEDYESSVKWALLMETDVEAYTNDDDSPDFQLNLSDFIKSLGPQKHLDIKSKSKKEAKPVEPNPFDTL